MGCKVSPRSSTFLAEMSQAGNWATPRVTLSIYDGLRATPTRIITMNITVSIDDLLTVDQQTEITEHLKGLAKDPIAAFCQAALAESADAIFNRRPERALSTETRLLNLIRHALKGAIPGESTVSRLFGITERKAQSMILTVANRYRAEFEDGWKAAAKAAFKDKESKTVNGLPVYRFSAPKTVIEYLNEVLDKIKGGGMSPIQKAKGTAERYEIAEDSYNEICKKLDIG